MSAGKGLLLVICLLFLPLKSAMALNCYFGTSGGAVEKSEAIQGAVAGMIIDPFKPKPVVNCIVNSAVNKFPFEEDEEVYSRK